MRGERRKKLHLSKIYTFACGKQSIKGDHSQIGGRGYSRVVFCNEPQESFEGGIRNYADNSVSSTKYTLATFLPKSLFEQFRRVANFYFLVTGSLAFTKLAPYTAVSAIVPLIIVIGATMVKEGIEDMRRKKQVLHSPSAFHLLFCFGLNSIKNDFFSTFLSSTPQQRVNFFVFLIYIIILLKIVDLEGMSVFLTYTKQLMKILFFFWILDMTCLKGVECNY